MRIKLQEIRDAIATIPQANIQKPLNMVVDLLEYRLDEHFTEQLAHNVVNLHAGLMGEQHDSSTPDVKEPKEATDSDKEQVSQKD